MIYGLNFNGKPIPPELKACFAEFKKFGGQGRGRQAHLKGVCESLRELEAMLIQADNGHREIYVHSAKRGGGVIHAVYVW